jgi:glycosyltransferase involved in cell wall biosynthesis
MILYVVRYFPTLTETFVRNEVEGLFKEGVPLALAAFGDRGDPYPEPVSFPVYSCPHRLGWLPWLPSLALEILKGGFASRRVLWLTALCRKLTIQRIHVHFAGDAAEWAFSVSQRLKIPFGLTTHAVDLFQPRPSLPALLSAACPLITISAFNADYIQKHWKHASEVVPCGVQLSSAPLKPLDYFVAVGRWVHKKGFEDLLKAWESLNRPATLLLISNPPSELSLPERVELLGLQPQRIVLEKLAQARALILPCKDQRNSEKPDMDGIPVVILEAMAAGVPVISTPVSGIPEVLDETVGWLVPEGQLEALKQAIQEAFDKPELAAEKGRRGKARIVEQRRTLEQQVTTMKQLLTGSSGG